MFMPDKHIKLSESLFGLGAYLLETLDEPRTMDELWLRYRADIEKSLAPSGHSFENVLLALDALFAIGAVKRDDSAGGGAIRRCA